MQFIRSLALLAVAGLNPICAATIYSWDASLEWISTSGADQLNLNNGTMTFLFSVLPGSPNVVPDPNGEQSTYSGVGSISLNGTPVGIASSRVSFFNPTIASDNGVANFFLDTVSGDPLFFYPALILSAGANANSASAPPLYTSGQIIDAFLLVPGVDPNDANLNAVYRMEITNFSSFVSEDGIPEPSSYALLGGGLAALFAGAHRRK